MSNQPPPLKPDQMLHIARKFEVAGRDKRNRATLTMAANNLARLSRLLPT